MKKFAFLSIFIFTFYLSNIVYAKPYHFQKDYFEFIVDVPNSWSAKKLENGYRFVSKKDHSRSVNIQFNYNGNNETPEHFALYLKNQMINNPEPGKTMIPKQIEKIDWGGPSDVMLTAEINGVETRFVISHIKNSLVILTITNTPDDDVNNIITSLRTK